MGLQVFRCSYHLLILGQAIRLTLIWRKLENLDECNFDPHIYSVFQSYISEFKTQYLKLNMVVKQEINFKKDRSGSLT
jgi:hypothetical protein